MHLGLSEPEAGLAAAHLLHHPAFRQTKDLPELIVGDFNDWRNRLVSGPAAEHGFARDDAAVAGSVPSRRTSRSARSTKRFAGKASVSTRSASSPGREARWASDHRPLVIDFHLKK